MVAPVGCEKGGERGGNQVKMVKREGKGYEKISFYWGGLQEQDLKKEKGKQLP